MSKKDDFEKQADATANAVRALTLLSLGGITFGIVAGLTRLLKIKSDIKETLSENVYSTASNISPELVETVSELSPATSMYVVENKPESEENKPTIDNLEPINNSQQSQESLEKSGVEYEDLMTPEKYFYNRLQENEAWYGALPILSFLVMPMLAIGAYSAITTLGLRTMTDNSKFKAKKKKEEVEKELASLVKAVEKKAHVKSAQGIFDAVASIFKMSTGFAAALSALVFFLSVPVFYQLFKSQQAGDVKDFIRRKILFQKLPSSVPVQLSKEDLKKMQQEEAEETLPKDVLTAVPNDESIKQVIMQNS